MRFEVIQDGGNAKVLPIIEYGDEKGWHVEKGTLMHLVSRGVYWYQVGRDGQETQLFGTYDGKGPAMMHETLPGTHVEVFSDLPDYGSSREPEEDLYFSPVDGSLVDLETYKAQKAS